MIIKLAITIPDSHITGDHKELEFIKKNTKDIYRILKQPVEGIHDIGEITGVNKHIRIIVKAINEMEADDREAVKKFKLRKK